MRKYTAVLMLLFALFAGQTIALAKVQAGQVAIEATPGEYSYQLFLPHDYVTAEKENWPLIIFLHGSGERGTDLAKVKVHGPPKIVDGNPNFPFILVSPQGYEDEDWNIDRLDRLLAKIRKEYRIDNRRIYLTGLSLGGFATWDWAIARPGIFAAIAPICGRSDASKAARLSKTPIWAFHGDSDSVVDPMGSIEMVRAVQAAGGNAKLTLYPGTDHDSWTQTYDNPALYYWLLQNRLP